MELTKATCRRCRIRPRVDVASALMALIAMIACDVIAAAATQDAKDAPASEVARGSANDLAELGETLKAAVLSGTLSEEDAIGIYKTMASRLEPKTAAGRSKGSPGPASAKLDVIMLSAPRPEQIFALFQPEFLRRDLPVLRDELDLDRHQVTIAEVLLGDYLEALDLASSPLREALGRYRRSATDQWLAAALERAQIGDVDVAVANTRDALEQLARGDDTKDGTGDVSPGAGVGSDEKRAARAAWARRMLDVTSTMEDRLASLRDRVQADLAELERDGATLTAADLVRMARQLRDERARLRSEMTESLQLITTIGRTGEEEARFAAAMARVRIERLLPQGRLGGESMNLWAALTDTRRSRDSRADQTDRLHHAEAMLREWTSWIAGKLDARTEAVLDRELSGLELQAARDRLAAANGGTILDVDRAQLGNDLQRFGEAARRELTASVTVRDELLKLLEVSGVYMDETYPDADVSTIYRQAALRRGFPTEMRQRWSERVLAAALRLDGLDDETRDALLAIDAETRAELQALRADAIARRIRRDPRLAREQIDARFGTERREKIRFSPELLFGFNDEAFASVDEATKAALEAVLSPEHLEALPARKRRQAKRGKDDPAEVRKK